MPVRRRRASRADHRVVVIAIAGAAGLALAASGCGDSGAPSPSALTRAAEADASYGVRYRYRSRSSEAGKKVIRVRGYAQTEADQRRSRIVMVGRDIRGEIVRDGHDEYTGGDLAVPGLLGSSSSKIRWTKLDGARFLKAGYIDKVCGAELPAKVAGALARTGPRIERLGSARVGGRPTTRYRVTTTYGKVLDTLAGNDDAAGCDARDRAAMLIADLWIDHDNLVRRVHVRVHRRAGVSSVETRDITAYDRDVRVAVPSGPAVGDVTDKLLSLADGLMSECSTTDDC